MYLKQGHRLHNDKYQLLNVLGEGGFSLTYRGAWKTEVQGNLGKIPTYIPVCIKEYFFKDYCLRNPHTCFVETNSETGKGIFDKNKEKIIKEARILSEIHYPNVVNVLEVFKQNNTVYIVMEFISGRSLKHEVEQNGVFTEEKLKKIIYTVGQALSYIHEKNILHLDIKPSNILMDNHNNPKLIDFGISKKYDLSNDQETSTTLLAASKGYASIEQYDSEGIQVFTPRPDIYSLGATMYYLVTGQVPTESILRSTKGLQNPRELNPDISDNTEKVILKAMALNASDRYESVMELLLDLGFDAAIDKIELTSASIAEYPETASQMTDEPYDFDAEDKTEIHSTPIIKNNRRKKYAWIYIIAFLLVSGLIAFLFYDNSGKNIQDEPIVDLTVVNNPPDSIETQTAPPEDVQIDNNTNNSESKPVVDQTPNPEDFKRENFQKLFAEAENAYKQNEFKLSLYLFSQAQTIDNTPAIEQYISLINKEIEKEEIQNRKDLYDDWGKFSNFVVVRRKSDNLVGAVDDKWIEIIEFKYVNTEPTKSGAYLLFQKEDNRYDVYDINGIRKYENVEDFDE